MNKLLHGWFVCTIFIIHSLWRIAKLTRSLRSLVRLTILHNSWIKIVRTHQPWSNLYVFLKLLRTQIYKIVEFHKLFTTSASVLYQIYNSSLRLEFVDPDTTRPLMLQIVHIKYSSDVHQKKVCLFSILPCRFGSQRYYWRQLRRANKLDRHSLGFTWRHTFHWGSTLNRDTVIRLN